MLIVTHLIKKINMQMPANPIPSGSVNKYLNVKFLSKYHCRIGFAVSWSSLKTADCKVRLNVNELLHNDNPGGQG